MKRQTLTDTCTHCARHKRAQIFICMCTHTHTQKYAEDVRNCSAVRQRENFTFLTKATSSQNILTLPCEMTKQWLKNIENIKTLKMTFHYILWKVLLYLEFVGNMSQKSLPKIVFFFSFFFVQQKSVNVWELRRSDAGYLTEECCLILVWLRTQAAQQ